MACGHENVGVVVETGGEVRDSAGRPLRPGDRVVPGANVACGECWFCRRDFPYYACERLEDYGNSLNAKRAPYLFGGWTEFMYLLPGTRLFRVPDATHRFPLERAQTDAAMKVVLAPNGPAA
jgi:threonine dehydrogenase-like Zn-dependent dehydrogenase